jgi:uncharacterized protein (TIGR02391 family)
MNNKIELMMMEELIEEAKALPDPPKIMPQGYAQFIGPQLLSNCIGDAIKISEDCFGGNNIHSKNLEKIKKLKYINAKTALLSEIIDMNRDLLTSDSPERMNFEMSWDSIHPVIVNVSKDRFERGFFADSVESAFKEINSRVKKMINEKIGKELDGSDLMFKAFSPKEPIIILDNLSTRSGMDIQQGYMYLFAGAIMAARNPKAHEVITISRERAMHYIALASLLMNKLEEKR